jgi:hypothetical protein
MHVALPGLGGKGYGLKVALVLTLSEQVRDGDEPVEPGHSRKCITRLEPRGGLRFLTRFARLANTPKKNIYIAMNKLPGFISSCG